MGSSITYDVFTAIEILLFENLRRLCTNELQRASFQRGVKSSYGVLASWTHLPFDAQFNHTVYRHEVYSAALSLKYATKAFSEFQCMAVSTVHALRVLQHGIL